MAVAAGLCQDISNDQIYSMGNMQMLCGILPLVSRDNMEGEDVRWTGQIGLRVKQYCVEKIDGLVTFGKKRGETST